MIQGHGGQEEGLFIPRVTSRKTVGVVKVLRAGSDRVLLCRKIAYRLVQNFGSTSLHGKLSKTCNKHNGTMTGNQTCICIDITFI